MSKIQFTISITGITLCTIILLYPPVIEYTQNQRPEQIRRLLLLPRTYEKKLMHYKDADGQKVNIVMTEGDGGFQKVLKQAEEVGKLVKLSDPEEVLHVTTKFDITKLLLELALVVLPTLGLWWLVGKIPVLNKRPEVSALEKLKNE